MIIINNQRSMIKNSRLHLVACNRNQRSTLHDITRIARHFIHHFTSFHVAFCIISCHTSYISLHASHSSHTHHACRVFCILRIARISCIAPHFTSFYVSFHVILSWKFIAYSFMPFCIEEKEKGQNAKLFNRAPPEWGVLIKRIKTPPDWGVFTNDKNATSSRHFISRVQFRPRVSFLN